MAEFELAVEALPWPIQVDDVSLLERLQETVRSLSPLARRGNDLTAIGEASDAIERILASEIVEVNVGLTVGFRQGNPDVFEEGHFASVRVNSHEIVLDQMDSTYAGGYGSDHYTTVCASLEPGGGFDGSGIVEWISRIDWFERDHI
jgi:hypothetical protein